MAGAPVALSLTLANPGRPGHLPPFPTPARNVTPSCHPGGMEQQLVLVEPTERPWELDERTREVGRRGLEQARAALRGAGREAA